MNPINRLTPKKEQKSMISFFNRKGKLYVQFVANGKKYQRSTKLDDTPKNRAFCKKEVIPKLQAKILNGEFNQKQKKLNYFEDYSTLYLKSKNNLKTYHELSNIVNNQLLPVFKNQKIQHIKRSDVKRFADEKLNHITPKRVSRLLQVLSAIFDIAVDYEDIAINPSKNIKLPKHQKKTEEPFTQQEVNTLLNNADGWFKNYLAFAFYTGARVGELIALTWADINLEDMYINIDKAKRQGVTSSPKTESGVRKIPIFEPLVPYIKNQMSNSKSIFVFTNPLTNQPFYGSKNLTTYWKKLLHQTKVKETRLYNTRHTFITTMLKNGSLSILEIAQIVGHSNTEMIVKNYANFIKGEQLKVSRKLNIFTDKSTDTKQQTKGVSS